MRRAMHKWMTAVILMLLLAGYFSVAAAQSTDPLVAPVLLKEAGLSQQWQVLLPIKPGETVERLFVFDRFLFILTSRNHLFCRNRSDGSYRFEMRLAEERLPVCDPLFMDGKVLFLVGRQLYVIDPVSGLRVGSAILTGVDDNSKCSISKNDDFLYVAGVDRRVHAYQITPTDYIHLFTATSDDDASITSVAAVEDRVYFTTQSGSVVAMQSDGPVRVWQFNASGPIQAPLVLDDDSIYVGSVDTKLYKLNAVTGRTEWPVPFYTGDKILWAPIIGDQVVYQVAGRSGLYAVEKEAGRQVWNVPNGRSLLCESGSTAYTFAWPGILVVMDNATGREVYSLNMAEVNRYAVNVFDATMYLADEQGRVTAIAAP